MESRAAAKETEQTIEDEKRLYNVLHVDVNGEAKERVTIQKGKDVKMMAEGFKAAYELISGYGNWEIFFFAESSMNKNGTKVSKRNNIT